MSSVNDLTGGDIELDGVIDVDFRVGESEGSSIVGNNIRNLIGADSLLGDLAELVLLKLVNWPGELLLWLLQHQCF